MSYPISEQLLSYNRPRTVLSPRGVVIHSTADPGATDEAERTYFNSRYVGGSAHYFVDWDSITRTIPENERAWHAGPTANSMYLSIEMCEPAGSDPAKFQEVWNRTVWLATIICVRYGWTNILSHNDITNMYGETTHTDPIEFLAQYGKTWDDLLNAIKKEVQTVENAILVYGPDDAVTARRLAESLGNCGIFFRKADGSASPDVKVAKTLYIVGGGSVGHPNEKILSGSNYFRTADAVGKALGQ